LAVVTNKVQQFIQAGRALRRGLEMHPPLPPVMCGQSRGPLRLPVPRPLRSRASPVRAIWSAALSSFGRSSAPGQIVVQRSVFPWPI
jgi:hypothetical protein